MRKYLLVALIFLASCISDNHKVQFAEYQNARYFKPSESMRAGIPKNSLEQQMLGHYFQGEAEQQGHFKVGDPYQISGVSYFPQHYEEFEEVGVASWYGADFHGKYTANGEIYDTSAMTAAHPTLPLPSMVRVTNLRNGRVVIVRVNDRGPYSQDRVIDVSERAAEELGFKDQGTTKVYIQLLRDDTDVMMKKLKIQN